MTFINWGRVLKKEPWFYYRFVARGGTPYIDFNDKSNLSFKEEDL
jgi:hypothetical protein